MLEKLLISKWAGIAFLGGPLIGSIAGMDSKQAMALSTAYWRNYNYQ